MSRDRGARRRVGITQRIIVGGVVAALLVGCASAPRATPAPASPQEVWAATPADCALESSDATAPRDLPSGASRITLCDETTFDLGVKKAPVDALVMGTDGVIEAWRALTPLASVTHLGCTADLGPAYRLILEYPNGSVATLTGELYGCHVAGGRVQDREGALGAAETVLQAFSEALQEQRTTKPASVDDPLAATTCGEGGTWVTPEWEATIGGYACIGRGEATRRVDMSSADWAVLAADAMSATSVDASANRPGCDEVNDVSLVGVSAGGDSRVLTGSCDVFERWHGGTVEVWTPSPAARAILDALR